MDTIPMRILIGVFRKNSIHSSRAQTVILLVQMKWIMHRGLIDYDKSWLDKKLILKT